MPLADSHSYTSIWASLLFETLFFSFYFQCSIQNTFFLFDNVNVWNKHLWKLKNLLCLFWKQTWAIGYISMKHAWTSECQCLFQYMLQAGYPPGWSVVNGKNEKTEWKWKNEKNTNEKLAKLKTRKGGLGKNEYPADWQPMKAIQAKMGQWKEFIPRWIENPKGRFRQKWGLKMKNERMKYWKSIDHRCEHPMFTQHWHA